MRRYSALAVLFAFAVSGCILGSGGREDDYGTVITWKKADGDHTVTAADVYGPDTLLVIERGVTVKFGLNAHLDIRGGLDVRGAKGDSVRFVGTVPEAETDIRISGGDLAEFDYAAIVGQINVTGEGTEIRMRTSVVRDSRLISGVAVTEGAKGTFSGCGFRRNVGYGNQIRCEGGRIEVSDCVFERNGTYCIYAPPAQSGDSCDVTIRDCVFRSNMILVLFIDKARLTLKNTSVELATWAGPVVYLQRSHIAADGLIVSDNGGTVDIQNSSGYLRDCRISGNTGASALSLVSTTNMRIENCTIAGNKSTSSTASAIFVLQSMRNKTPRMTNSIVWGNSGNSVRLYSKSDSLYVTYSDIAGGWPGTGNITAEPLFTNPAAGDYRLARESLCIDAGDPTSKDPNGTRADMGSRVFP